MRAFSVRHRQAPLVALSSILLACGACGSDSTEPKSSSDKLILTAAMVKSLDSTAQVMVAANPGNAALKALVDSTLLVLTAGVEAQRLNVTTDLTTAPLYFVGVHRAVVRPTGSYSTWTLVGFDDPAHLANLVEVSGFAQSSGSTPPSFVSGTIGNGTGIVNALMLQVGSGGAVTQWNASSGSASFSSDELGAACPGFTPAPKVTCALETTHAQFSAIASSGSGGAGPRQAAVATAVGVPTMRLTVTP